MFMKCKLIKVFFMCVLGTGLAFSATVKGTVRCHGDKFPLENALITIETKKGELVSEQTLTDRYGYFEFRNVKEGIYKIAGMKEGFYSNCLFDFAVTDNGVYEVTIRLIRNKSGAKDMGYCFMIGGIEVEVKDKEILPEEIATTRKIDSGEIDHLQATNLGDVLSLVPGVEKSGNPGLEDTQNIGLRKVKRSDQGLSGYDSFGTSVVVDGNEVTGDAQLSSYVSGSSEQSGMDLRAIPADNIESVEVITGVASVEYGNYADGIVKVNTKKGDVRGRFKAKINPKTKGFSYSGGNKLKESTLNYHVNYSYSERDLRKIGDEYQRFYSSLFWLKDFMDDKLSTQLGGTFTRIFDDEEPNDEYRMQNTGHNYSISGKFRAKYTPTKDVKYNLFLGYDMKNTDYVKQKLVYDQLFLPVGTDVSSIDTGYCSVVNVVDTIWIAGTDSIDFLDSSVMVFPYNATISQKGKEFDYSFKLKRRSNHTWGKTNNKLLFGIETDYEENNGEGVTIDSIFNYYGVQSSKKSYSFDIYPGNLKISLYGEDQMSFDLFKRKTELLLGLRYDVFNPRGLGLSTTDGFSFLDAKQGEFLSPRLNLRYHLSDNFILRGGIGQSVKSVSLSQIYKTPKHVSYMQLQEDSTYAVAEKVFYQTNEELKAYSTMKQEVSADWKMSKKVGVSLTAYRSETNNRPRGITYPEGYDINPDTINTVFTYSINENTGWEKSSGLELALRTKRIRDIRYALNLTYRQIESGSNSERYDYDYAATDASWELWYPDYSTWQQKLIVDAQASYISQRFGAWITVDVQYIPFHQVQKKYTSNGFEEFNDDGDPYTFYQGMSYWYDAELYNYTNQWLVNLRLSKSLGQRAEISMYINNLFDDRAIWYSPYSDYEYEMNSPIYYGLEMSVQL